MDRKILEKAKKLQALVERGEMGEALAAKRALDALCLANGLDIETLFNEKKERKYFKLPYYNEYARKLLFQCLHKVLNVGSFEYRSNKYKTVVSIELTDAEYIETKEMYEFYFKQWKKEVKSMMNDLYEAFLNKYDIFSEDAESDDTEMTPEKWEKILRIMRMSEQLEDVSFFKRNRVTSNHLIDNKIVFLSNKENCFKLFILFSPTYLLIYCKLEQFSF